MVVEAVVLYRADRVGPGTGCWPPHMVSAPPPSVCSVGFVRRRGCNVMPQDLPRPPAKGDLSAVVVLDQSSRLYVLFPSALRPGSTLPKTTTISGCCKVTLPSAVLLHEAVVKLHLRYCAVEGRRNFQH